MASNIKMTPSELREGSSFIKARRDAIVGEVDAMRSKINEVSSRWEGASQTAYMSVVEEMYPMLKEKFPEAIEGLAKAMETAAQILEEADRQIAGAMSQG